jgi:hypothetical protein
VDYLCRWVSGEARAASDALEAAWASPEDLPTFDLPPKALEVVGDAFRRAALRPAGGARILSPGTGARPVREDWT